MLIRKSGLVLGLALALGISNVTSVRAQEAAEKAEGVVSLAGGKIRMKAPAQWKSVPPKNNIILSEFAAPADAAKEKQARITISSATGGVQNNIDRWYGQFSQPDGSATKDKAKVEKFEAAGQTVHFVDIPGTFADSGGAGPFQQAPAVKRENYRMLGAVIETKDYGTLFVKATGPAESIETLKEGFRKMLDTMEVKSKSRRCLHLNRLLLLNKRKPPSFSAWMLGEPISRLAWWMTKGSL